jgi:hypothetical protein
MGCPPCLFNWSGLLSPTGSFHAIDWITFFYSLQTSFCMPFLRQEIGKNKTNLKRERKSEP